MKKTFNLLDEAWIPCTDQNNQIRKVSLTEAIVEAHQLRQLVGELPTINGSLHLLLIAFAMSVYEPEDLDEWEQLYEKGKFDKEKLKEYCAHWHERFYLFDDEHPFYQDNKIGKRPKDIEKLGQDGKAIQKGLTGHLLHLSSGSNATLFDHTMDDNTEYFLPDEAARLLVMIQTYSLGGMGSASIGKDKYYKDAPFSRGVTFLCRGENLYETLLRNMVPVSSDFLNREGNDTPSWEKDDPFGDIRETPNGLIDLMTWQSRRMWLEGEEIDGKLASKYCLSAPGYALPETFANPFYLNHHEVTGSKIQIRPLRFQQNRVIWRDSSSILDVVQSKSDKPITRSLFETLHSEQITEDHMIKLTLFGMRTEPGQKKVYQYLEESFDAPAVYLENRELYQRLKEALELAEGMRKVLYFATYELASYKTYPEQDTIEGFSPDRKMVNAFVDHITQEGFYWSKLEPHFYDLMENLPIRSDAFELWKNVVMVSAKESLREVAEQCGNDYSGLKARAKAENKFYYEMQKFVNPNNKED